VTTNPEGPFGDQALLALAHGAQWVRRVALPNVPEAYRASFMERNPTNRALLAAARFHEVWVLTNKDSIPAIHRGLEGRPEARNLVGIYGAVTGQIAEQVLARFSGQGFGAFKPALADAIIALLTPLRSRLEEFRKDPAMLDSLLERGAAKAAELAAPTLAEAYAAVGLSRPCNA